MKYHLAQINIAKLLKPIDHPQIADFVNQLDEINALADDSEGFVWRLKDEGSNNVTEIESPFDDNLIVNMSVWENAEMLKNYIYNSGHIKVFMCRKEWFDKPTNAHMALWWIEAGTIPTLEEAKAKLALIDKSGATQDSFLFHKVFDAPK